MTFLSAAKTSTRPQRIIDATLASMKNLHNSFTVQIRPTKWNEPSETESAAPLGKMVERRRMLYPPN